MVDLFTLENRPGVFLRGRGELTGYEVESVISVATVTGSACRIRVECGNEILIRFEAFAAGANSTWQTNKYRGSWFPAMLDCYDNPGCQTNGDRTQTLTLSIYVLFFFASHGTSHVGFAALHRRGLVIVCERVTLPGGEPRRVSAPSANAGVRRRGGDSSSRQ